MRESERINIGTYQKVTAFKMKGEILRWAKIREQKVKVFFKGRGKGSTGSGNYKKTPKVAIYVEVYPKDQENILGYSIRERLIEQGVRFTKEYEHLDTLLRLGFVGFKNLTDEKLIEEVLAVIEKAEVGR